MEEIIMKLKSAMTALKDRRTPKQKRIDLLMNLRMFDEGGSNGGDDTGDNSGDGGSGDGGDDDGADEVQAKIDAAVAAAIKKQDELWEKKFKERLAKEKQKTSEAEKLAKMTESEKISARIKALEEENAAMKAAQARNEMAAQVRSLLSEKNITVTSDVIVESLIGADADKTSEAVNAFAAEFEKAVNARVKEALKGKAPKGGSSGGSKGMTKAEIMKIKNPIERQKMIAAHPDAFK